MRIWGYFESFKSKKKNAIQIYLSKKKKEKIIIMNKTLSENM